MDNSNENLLTSIKEACNKKWIITASAGETEASRELLREVGLIPLHTYIIMDIYDLSQFDDNNNNNFANNLNISNSQSSISNSNYDNILKIKNPWGKNEWIGDWSDFSNLWREDLKIKLNYSNTDKCFYMNFKDFKHYFSKIQICKINDNYNYNSLQITQNLNSYSLIKITITESLNYFNQNPLVYVSLIQNEIKKNFINIDRKYSIARIILSKLNFFNDKEFEVDYISGKISQEKELFEEKELEPGEYILFVEVDRIIEKNQVNDSFDNHNFCDKNNNKIQNKKQNNSIKDLFLEEKFVISTFALFNIELKQVRNEDFPNILQKIYISCAKKDNNVLRFSNDGAPNCLK